MSKPKLLLSGILSIACSHAFAGIITANNDNLLGLYPANSVELTTGKCTDCATIPQARWYFEKELIAAPKQEKAHTTLSKVTFSKQNTTHNINATSLPPLIWLGSSQVIPQAKISEDGQHITLDSGEKFAFGFTPKISTNLSYWNDSTLKFYSQRSVRLRGELEGTKFTARTVWPSDFTIAPNAPLKPLTNNESLKSLVQFENGGAKSAYESRLIWAKNADTSHRLTGKAVIGFMLNGAQGDDDEAHGGHFAVVTGRMEGDGDYSRWLVNNYYNLASNSEKGIIAAVTPLDKYLADLNNGQSFYRPSYMLVAVLKNDQIPAQFQTATNSTYNHFYRNDFIYDHSRDNCAGISIDTLRTLGWDIPMRGVESQLKATAAYFYVGATEKSLTKGRAIYDYLNTETTRLFPAVTFDAVGNYLLNLTAQPNAGTPFKKQLSDDIEAIYFVRIPQIPSSRAFGLAPVYSFNQFMTQAPADRSQWKVVPTTPRPFPESLRDGAALKLEKPSLMPWPVLVITALLLLSLQLAFLKFRKKLRQK